MKIVTIVPLEKKTFKENLTYFSAKDIEIGHIVSVPMRNKKILGLVVSCENAKDIKSSLKDMSFKLRKVIETKEDSIFRNEFIESAQELSSYFVLRKQNAIASFIPSLFLEKYDELKKILKQKKWPSNGDSDVKNEKLLFQAQFEDRISFYKTLIRGQFALKKSVFIVLPTEYDIELFYESLSKGIENFVFCMHTGIKPLKIIEKYREIIDCPHGILILGTAQFLSIPRTDFGTIIVEHESSSAYKMIPKPHLDSRIFAEIYASKIKAKFILGDTLLRYETIARKETESLGEIYPLSFRIDLSKINFEVTNPNPEKNNFEIKTQEKNKVSKFRIFSEKTIEEIENKIERKKNIFIFSLRKGLSTHTICRDCNETITCENCSAPVVLYFSKDNKKRMFVCNKCNTEKDPETVCPRCKSWNLFPLGIGTDTVLEEIKNKFPKVKIFKLDKETVKTAKNAEKIINDFKKYPASILIGTEMVFYYLKEKVSLSVISSFDSLWSIPNFRISEKIIHLILSIISKTEEKIILQTKNDNDLIIKAIKSENLVSLVREELEDRKKLNYPPFKRFIKITFLGNKESSLEARNFLKEILKDYNPEIFSGFISKNKNHYITNALIRINTSEWSLPEISISSNINKNLYNILFSLPLSYEIFIDPEDLL